MKTSTFVSNETLQRLATEIAESGVICTQSPAWEVNGVAHRTLSDEGLPTRKSLVLLLGKLSRVALLSLIRDTKKQIDA